MEGHPQARKETIEEIAVDTFFKGCKDRAAVEISMLKDPEKCHKLDYYPQQRRDRSYYPQRRYPGMNSTFQTCIPHFLAVLKKKD